MKPVMVVFLSIAVMAGATLAWADQVPISPQLEALWNEIQQLKQQDSEISADLYQRYFELEQQLYPERFARGGDRGLDQGMDGCPGYPIVQPEGLFDWVDYGQTYNYNNDCTIPACRTGRDVVYSLTVTAQDSLQITTCGSGFDTYLCIYSGVCCQSGSLVFSNDDSDICGTGSLRSGIRGCFVPGDYFIVVDGFNQTAQGHYQLNIQSLTGGQCGQNPELECPPDFLQHVEGPDEGVCEYGTSMECPARFCGAVDGLGDLDVYNFVLTECTIVILSAWGNDTPGHSGSGHGLDPILNLYTTECESPIYTNDDVIGNPPDLTGHDSRIITLCLRPATYWVELGGDETNGLYEFAYDCEPCGEQQPVAGVSRDDSNPNGPCLSWSGDAGFTYYVWRSISGGPWALLATTPNTTYCDSTNPQSPQYLVFDDPCGSPSD